MTYITNRHPDPQIVYNYDTWSPHGTITHVLGTREYTNTSDTELVSVFLFNKASTFSINPGEVAVALWTSPNDMNVGIEGGEILGSGKTNGVNWIAARRRSADLNCTLQFSKGTISITGAAIFSLDDYKTVARLLNPPIYSGDTMLLIVGGGLSFHPLAADPRVWGLAA